MLAVMLLVSVLVGKARTVTVTTAYGGTVTAETDIAGNNPGEAAELLARRVWALCREYKAAESVRLYPVISLG